ncbi:MAG: cytochrome c biogenesis protein ResB, partial [Actinopolymorphaceae bacterium]
GSITFEGYDRWVNLQVSRNPGEPVALVGAILALGGLLLSLVVRRRRVWVRVTEDDGRTVVAVAGLDRAEPALASRGAETTGRGATGTGDRSADGHGTASDLAIEIDKLAAGLQRRAASREERE